MKPVMFPITFLAAENMFLALATILPSVLAYSVLAEGTLSDDSPAPSPSPSPSLHYATTTTRF